MDVSIGWQECVELTMHSHAHQQQGTGRVSEHPTAYAKVQFMGQKMIGNGEAERGSRGKNAESHSQPRQFDKLDPIPQYSW